MPNEKLVRDAYRVLNVRPDAHQVVLRAAFHALAALYHPDHNQSPDADAKMAELNLAYAKLRTPDLRAVYERVGEQVIAPKAWEMGGGAAPPPSRRPGTEDSAVLAYGRYEGWTVADLALHDPDYLRWLARHASGLRYRPEIERRLGASQRVAAPSKPKARSAWSRLGI